MYIFPEFLNLLMNTKKFLNSFLFFSRILRFNEFANKFRIVTYLMSQTFFFFSFQVVDDCIYWTLSLLISPIFTWQQDLSFNFQLTEIIISRYKACWLPLLAKHTESGFVEGSLDVPIDCEWIWHCHRLNPVTIYAQDYIQIQRTLFSPFFFSFIGSIYIFNCVTQGSFQRIYLTMYHQIQVQYRKDCEEVYGRILGNQNVESSVQGKSKHQTAAKWAELYPDEPFDLVDASNPSSGKNANMHVEAVGSITYDLVSAVKRQSSFYYQVAEQFTLNISVLCLISHVFKQNFGLLLFCDLHYLLCILRCGRWKIRRTAKIISCISLKKLAL